MDSGGVNYSPLYETSKYDECPTSLLRKTIISDFTNFSSTITQLLLFLKDFRTFLYQPIFCYHSWWNLVPPTTWSQPTYRHSLIYHTITHYNPYSCCSPALSCFCIFALTLFSLLRIFPPSSLLPYEILFFKCFLIFLVRINLLFWQTMSCLLKNHCSLTFQ